MDKSYSKKYLYIYFWQGISIILNLVSLFIVVPYISRAPDIYGIYTICISVSLFLLYADLGFVNAGYKYASECFAKGNQIEEIRIVGFVTFVLLLFVSMYFIAIFFLSYHPEYLIRGLRGEHLIAIASKMLLIQAFSSVIIILQRCVQIIYGIRLENYIYQRILICGSVLKIISIFYFFSATNYKIINYYLFIQVINFSCVALGIWIASRRYNYNIFLLVRSIKYSKEIYNKTRHLAFGAFLLTISWVLYYELDTFAIARMLGARAVSYYAIGLTILSFYRSFFGTLFSPFNARFNHFIALENDLGLKKFYLHVICITLPIVTLPILSLYMLMPSFILNWVGDNYEYSINLSRILILSNVLAFIAYPTSGLVIAKHRIKLLNVVSFTYPIVFWVGVLLTYKYLNIFSFAIFKLVAFIIAGVVYFIFAIKFLRIKLISFFREVIFPGIPAIIFVIISLGMCVQYLPLERNKWYMLLDILIGALACFGGCILYYIFSKKFRDYVLSIKSKILFSG